MFGLILVIGVMIRMVAGSLGTLLTANLQSKVSENCLQSSKSLWVCVASLGAHWVPEAWFDPARTTISLLMAVVVVTEFLWSNSTVQISKDISPLYAASFCVIYLFALGWFVLTRWEGNCGNQLLGMIGGFFDSSVVCRSSLVPKLPHF